MDFQSYQGHVVCMYGIQQSADIPDGPKDLPGEDECEALTEELYEFNSRAHRITVCSPFHFLNC